MKKSARMEIDRLEFVKSKRKQKFKIWKIYNNRKFGFYIGWIDWFFLDDCYVFVPITHSYFDPEYLREIASFCEKQTVLYRKKKAGRNNQS